MALGLACIHGVVGQDLVDCDLDLLTNAEDDLALPGSQMGVVVDLQLQQMLTVWVFPKTGNTHEHSAEVDGLSTEGLN